MPLIPRKFNSFCFGSSVRIEFARIPLVKTQGLFQIFSAQFGPVHTGRK